MKIPKTLTVSVAALLFASMGCSQASTRFKSFVPQIAGEKGGCKLAGRVVAAFETLKLKGKLLYLSNDHFAAAMNRKMADTKQAVPHLSAADVERLLEDTLFFMARRPSVKDPSVMGAEYRALCEKGLTFHDAD